MRNPTKELIIVGATAGAIFAIGLWAWFRAQVATPTAWERPRCLQPSSCGACVSDADCPRDHRCAHVSREVCSGDAGPHCIPIFAGPQCR